MSFVTLSRRMEIAFWTSWVSTLRLARAARWLPTLLGLSVCLVSLLFVSAFTRFQNAPGGGISSPVKGALAVAPQAGRTPIVQQNTLVLIIDRLEGGPARLQGAWLLVSDPDFREIVFLPIYPSGAPGKPTPPPDLNRLFRQNASGAPGEAFFEALRQKRIWWNHYVMVDYASLAALVELSGGVFLDGELNPGAALTGGQVIDWLAASDPAPQAILARQAALLGALCRRSGRLIAATHPDLMSGLLTGSGQSDLSPDAFRQGWEQARQAGSLVCEFPTLPGGGQ